MVGTPTMRSYRCSFGSLKLAWSVRRPQTLGFHMMHLRFAEACMVGSPIQTYGLPGQLRCAEVCLIVCCFTFSSVLRTRFPGSLGIPSFRPSICLSVYLSVRLSVDLSVRMSIYLSISRISRKQWRGRGIDRFVRGWGIYFQDL